MIFPAYVLEYDLYLEKIKNHLSGIECKFFIDTNVIASFFRFHNAAKKELFSWISEKTKKGQFKTPSWTINEYSNKVISDKLTDYYSIHKTTTKTISSKLGEFKDHAKNHVDSGLLKSTSYSGNVSAFFDDLGSVEKTFKKISEAFAGSIDNKYINEEIIDLLSTSILKSNIFELAKRASEEANVRFANRLPPGYMDKDKGTKDQNAYGDLIIWYEILNYCKENKVEKCIFITNDQKKDWVYAPPKIKLTSGIVKGNNDPLVKIADPRLVYEFSLATKSREFYIIDLSILIQCLNSIQPEAFKNVAIAIQIEEEDFEQSLKNNPSPSEEENQKSISCQEKSELTEEEFATVTPPLGPQHEETFLFLEAALSDELFDLSGTDEITQIIKDLKSYNWYTQNPAITKISNLDLSSFGKNQIFVLGRNIYQAACGSAMNAVKYIKSLNKRLSMIDENVANHLVAGMFFEAYFDSKGDFRGNKIKDEYLCELFELQNNPKVYNAIEFINKQLEPYSNNLPVIPFHEPMIANLNIVATCITDDKGDRYNLIKDITLNDKSIIFKFDKDNYKEFPVDTIIFSHDSFFNKDKIIQLICSGFFIPHNQLKYVMSDNIDSNLKFNLQDEFVVANWFHGKL